MMPYGEAHVAEQHSLHLKNAVWKQNIQIHPKPKRMNREDAAKYYNVKLFTYWLNQLDDSLPPIQKETNNKFIYVRTHGQT
ncbi:MAG: hypothetical protein ACI9TV_002424 [Sulfurimonas sp.]|jgi:hypothetical protein|uniref:hypothetical protein n=1 Tax=Sulfurimonas sp. TaxID=2022749 RepID=UPI0039E36A97